MPTARTSSRMPSSVPGSKWLKKSSRSTGQVGVTAAALALALAAAEVGAAEAEEAKAADVLESVSAARLRSEDEERESEAVVAVAVAVAVAAERADSAVWCLRLISLSGVWPTITAAHPSPNSE